MEANSHDNGRAVPGPASQSNTSRFARRKPAGGREIALFVLHAVWEEGAYTSLALGRVLRKAEGGGADRRLATELVYGAIKAKEGLDFLLRKLTRKAPQRLEPVVREILHLGLYQIFTWIASRRRRPATKVSIWRRNLRTAARIDLSTRSCATASVNGTRCGSPSRRTGRCASAIPGGSSKDGRGNSVRPKRTRCAAGTMSRQS